ncbi:MAG: 2-oxoglutarate dehydrogenase E1 component [Nitrospirae bacterium]|nr:2-oxoglutarate dehydrogenase E1 component [Nitrospirota bacterium]
MSETEREPSFLSLAFVEGLYADYLRDPSSVPLDWRRYFEEVGGGNGTAIEPRLGPTFRPSSLFNPPGVGASNGQAKRHDVEVAALQDRVDQMIRAYRVRGHMIARLDPLRRPRPHFRELDPEFYGLTEADMERSFSTRTIQGPQSLTLRQIFDRMRNTYCRFLGVQFMHIDDPTVKSWLQERMEGTENRLELSRNEQMMILTRLTDAVIFEEFIQKKFIGAKSFSLEGAETLIPLLELAIEKAGQQGIGDVVLSMAHRGRLNVLANIMGKHPREIFREFEDAAPELHIGRGDAGTSSLRSSSLERSAGGDVKYHLGHSNDWVTSTGQTVHLTLCFNPSHLEFVNPVALGRLRAKQDREGDRARSHAMGILIHGDAAFAGEGITQETLNLSQLQAYSTGGTLHIVVNNQIGFTTPPEEGRSSTYCTDVAKMLQVPIFHVNGEDPESVAQAVRLAMDFRQKFRRDVVIDMYCYRRRGHNEGDEPSFTQPLLYREIEKRLSIRDDYLKRLLKMGGVPREEADRIGVERREQLERELAVARSEQNVRAADTLGGSWTGYFGGYERGLSEVETAVPRDRLATLLTKQTELPPGFRPHPKTAKWLEMRKEVSRGKQPVDWSAAEALAFGSLATEGFRIRLTGQDTARGTFSQRHAMLHDVEDGHAYMPLQHLDPNQAPVEICNSPLSETAVLGFEYGYSLDTPKGLVAWEAQFGDFCNVAQVIIDQFIVSGEEKWQRLSGLVLLLPHGFEGMGPEHSSARLERFLALSAEDNIQVVNLTTPAQYFHCLRRQALSMWKKPLVIMTPKSMLRHPKAVSSLKELSHGRFERVMPDSHEGGPHAKLILLCSGKVYYDLLQKRDEAGRSDVAIIRLEQLYPLAEDRMREVFKPYADGTPVRWVQEEPENMGAWRYMDNRYCATFLDRFPFSGVCRPASASPATGSASSHRLEQSQLVERAFAPPTETRTC